MRLRLRFKSASLFLQKTAKLKIVQVLAYLYS